MLTGMPGKDRVSPDEALLFLRDVRRRLTLTVLDEEDRLQGAGRRGRGWYGGRRDL